MRTTNPLRWGILGTGHILTKLCGGFRLARNVSLVAIASRDLDRARSRAAEFEIPKAHGSYQELLNDPEVDIVINALHNGLHCEWTIRALEAGKHVLCEKPLACSSDEVERMFASAHAHKRWLMEAFMFRFHPQIAEVKRRIAAGDIGEPLYIRSTYMAQRLDPKNVRYRKEFGGGALFDLGCYCVNFSRCFADAEPAQVLAQAHWDEETGVDLTLSGTLTFGNAVAGGRASRRAEQTAQQELRPPDTLTAHFSCSLESEGVFGGEIVGTEGKIFIPHPWLSQTWPAEYTITRGMKSETIRVEDPSVPQNFLAPFALEIEHLAACVRENRAPQFLPGTDAEGDSRANMRTMEALLDSAQSGKVVALVENS
jgi:xylose dehydrogenase (NAD/NADP)